MPYGCCRERLLGLLHPLGVLVRKEGFRPGNLDPSLLHKRQCTGFLHHHGHIIVAKLHSGNPSYKGC